MGVLLPLPLAGPYDYRVPEGMAVAPGDFVRVPLGRRSLTGVVWGEAACEVEEGRLRAIAERLDLAPLPEPTRRLVDWVAAYTLAPPGAVLKMALSVPSALEPPAPVPAYALAAPPPAAPPRLTEARRRVLALLEDGAPKAAAELAAAAEVGMGVLKGLAQAGLIVAAELPAPAERGGDEAPDPNRPGPTLSAEQAAAAQALAARLAERAFSVSLIDGVTGSGKTEVYFEAIAQALRQGRQSLVLLPEIALSAQWLARFRARFGAPPLVWHSELGEAERRRTWRAVARGAAPVVVGARSALFLPFADLGLIVVDEEHEAAFKQDDGVPYHARDMAVVRAQLGGVPAILASATPSLESLANVQAGRYHRIDLPTRHAGATLPALEVIDLRKNAPPRHAWISPPLREAVSKTLAAGEQAMLFLNRRGYAPLTLCKACGHRLQCPSCSAWLVEHKARPRLQCHHCGHVAARPESCPACGEADSFTPCGPGVERVAEEAAGLWPEARLAVMSSDTLATPRQAAELVARVQAHEVDLLVGTQIAAKGHHFPLLTLVGVIDADLGLQGADLRAKERTFQMLSQVAGRAGRAERPGRVLLQTYMPEQEVLKALLSGQRERFLALEAQERRNLSFPPFGRLAALIVSGEQEARVDQVAQALGRTAPQGEGIEVLGPAPAPLALLRGRHRRRLLLKVPKRTNLQELVRQWLARAPADASVRVQVDIDPYSFV